MYYNKKNLKSSNKYKPTWDIINPLNAELNPMCHLLPFVEALHILHVSRVRVKELSIKHSKTDIQELMMDS